MVVKVYTTVACPYCCTLKLFLQQHGVVFEEIDVTQNGEAREEMIQKSNQISVPVLDIDGEIVTGFDKEKIEKLLNIQ